MNRIGLLLFLGLMLVCSSCVTRTLSAVVQGDDEKSSVALCTGCEMTVNLPGNPTTGYLWEITTMNLAVLRQIGEPEFTPERDLIGSGGTVTFRFMGIEAGSTTLKLVYHRPFEKDTPPVRTRELQVVVSRQ